MLRNSGPVTRRGRRVTAIGLAGLMALGMAACSDDEEPTTEGTGGGGGGNGEPVDMGDSILEDADLSHLVADANEEGRVIIYGSQEEVIYDDLIAAFNERFPDIEVELYYFSGADDWERILAEIAAGVAEIDGITPTVQNPVDAMEIDAFRTDIDWASYGVPEDNIWEDGVSVFWGNQMGGISYSTERVSDPDELPNTWEECADPKWSGEFVVDTRPSFPFALLHELGEDELYDLMQQWKDNNPVFRRGQTATVETLSAGEYAFLCGSGYDAYRNVEAKGGAVGWKWIDPVPLYPRRGFVLTEAEHPNAAILWYLFTFTDDAQAILDRIGNALYTSPACQCFEEIEGMTVSYAHEEDMVNEEEVLDTIVNDIWQVVEQ